MERIIHEYLMSRSCRIDFSQSDQNACPVWKGLTLGVLQFHYEGKLATLNFEELSKSPRLFTRGMNSKITELKREAALKKFQENDALASMKEHNERNAHIRGSLRQKAIIIGRLRTAIVANQSLQEAGIVLEIGHATCTKMIWQNWICGTL